jgi:hypothetical protein
VQTPNGPGTLIPGSIGLKERLLTSKEVGKFLAFSVTPRRNDGLEGETKSFVSRERIMPGKNRPEAHINPNQQCSDRGEWVLRLRAANGRSSRLL